MLPTAAATDHKAPLSRKTCTVSPVAKLADSVPLTACCAVRVMKSVVDAPVSAETAALATEVAVAEVSSMGCAGSGQRQHGIGASRITYRATICSQGCRAQMIPFATVFTRLDRVVECQRMPAAPADVIDYAVRGTCFQRQLGRYSNVHTFAENDLD